MRSSAAPAVERGRTAAAPEPAGREAAAAEATTGAAEATTGAAEEAAARATRRSTEEITCSTTLSPAVTPLVIWVSPLWAAPTVTGFTTWAPFTTWVTVAWPLELYEMAAVGTSVTLLSCLTMMFTAAVEPAYRPAGLPVTSMTTGKVVTLELWLPIRLMEATVP